MMVINLAIVHVVCVDRKFICNHFDNHFSIFRAKTSFSSSLSNVLLFLSIILIFEVFLQ